MNCVTSSGDTFCEQYTPLPLLRVPKRWEAGPQFRTSMQCRANQGNGESFLADVWFSTYEEGQSPKLAAIIADVTEERSSMTPTRAAENTTPRTPTENPRILSADVASQWLSAC